MFTSAESISRMSMFFHILEHYEGVEGVFQVNRLVIDPDEPSIEHNVSTCSPIPTFGAKFRDILSSFVGENRENYFCILAC